MSADNGIYLIETPIAEGSKEKEYRVKHAQAIDNIYWDEDKYYPDHHNPEGNPSQVVAYFGECEVFTNLDDAWKLARKMEEEILSDDYCPILEYGISSIKLPHPFSYYKQNAIVDNALDPESD